jgi:CelD/BcsL family acetyltransferase involved in cellulose biosynthesis
MTSPRLNARVLKPEALSAGEVALWDNLCEGVPQFHSAFYTHSFALAASKAGYRVRVAILEDLNGIVGFFPFQFRHRLAESLGLAERVGEEMSDYFGMVTKPTVRVTPGQLLAACRLNCCYFTHLDEWQTRMGLTGERPEPSPRIELPENIEEYWKEIKRRDKKFIADTNRCNKKLERDYGKVRFDFQSVDRIAEFYLLINLKRNQYIATINKDLLSIRNREHLLRNLLHVNSNGCKGVMSVLRAGTEVAALHFGLQCHDVLHYWFPVYNPALKAYAPGRLLLSRLLEVSHEQGIRIIDLGAGDSEAKRKLANSKLTVCRGMWSRNSTTRFVGRTLTFFQWRLGIPFM